MKTGLEQIRDQNILPAMQAKIGCELLVAACDDVFSGMANDLVSDGLERLGSIPLEHCARCKAPVFTHQATQIAGRHYCETCAKAEKATVPKPDVGGI